MKSELFISLHSEENPGTAVLRIKLNTNQPVEVCQRIIGTLMPDLLQKLSAPVERIYNDDVTM